MTPPRTRDHNGECLFCDEQGPHAPDCPGYASLLARLRTDALCIQPEFCAAVRQEVAFELELLRVWLELGSTGEDADGG